MFVRIKPLSFLRDVSSPQVLCHSTFPTERGEVFCYLNTHLGRRAEVVRRVVGSTFVRLSPSPSALSPILSYLAGIVAAAAASTKNSFFALLQVRRYRVPRHDGEAAQFVIQLPYLMRSEK